MNRALLMTQDELLQAAFNMQMYGGSFAAAIAQAFYAADSTNRRRLIEAFGDLFVEYSATDVFG